MRGYRRLKETDGLHRITALKAQLTTTRFERVVGRASRPVFGAALPHAEIAVRQFVLARFAHVDFNAALLRSVATGEPMAYPLPAEWRRVIREHGFPVAGLTSAVRWHIACVMLFGAAAVWVVKRINLSWLVRRRRGRLSARSAAAAAHFHAIAPPNIPNPGPDGRSFDVVTWYACAKDRPPDITTILHEVDAPSTEVCGVPVHGGQPLVRPLASPRRKALFCLWSFWAACLAMIDLLRNRWWHALLFREAMQAAMVRYQHPDRIPKEILYHNSSWVYRPLLTYEAERAGARTRLYFYSANTEGFKSSRGYPPPFYGWAATNWPECLVWDDYQADFMSRSAGAGTRIRVVGAIPFTSSPEQLPHVPGRCLAVFDVTPMRPSFYARLGLDFEYYTADTSMAFLESLHAAAIAYRYTLLWKRKRKMSAVTHRRFRAFAEDFGTRAGVQIVDPDVSAVRVIERATLVASMPFTSTALVARELQKPSCYYDAVGRLQRDDRAAHGIQIVQGMQELREWIGRQTKQTA